jgi:hypothetical protein
MVDLLIAVERIHGQSNHWPRELSSKKSNRKTGPLCKIRAVRQRFGGASIDATDSFGRSMDVLAKQNVEAEL